MQHSSIQALCIERRTWRGQQRERKHNVTSATVESASFFCTGVIMTSGSDDFPSLALVSEGVAAVALRGAMDLAVSAAASTFFFNACHAQQSK